MARHMRLSFIAMLLMFFMATGAEPMHAKDTPVDSKNLSVTDTGKKTGFSKDLLNVRARFGDFMKTDLAKAILFLSSICLTASMTWYINFKLSHLKPILSLFEAEFIYDLADVKDIVEIPEKLVEYDASGFFSPGLQNFMPLEDLEKFSKKDRPNIVAGKYKHFRKQIDLFLKLLENPRGREEILGSYAMDFLRSGGFSGVATFIVAMEEKGLVPPLTADQANIQRATLKDGSIKVANNLVLLPNSWTNAAKSENQKFMAVKIEQFAKLLLVNLNVNHLQLKSQLLEYKRQLEKTESIDLSAENGIIEFIEHSARKHKKVVLRVQMVNRSEFPILFDTECEIHFRNMQIKKQTLAKGKIQRLNADPSNKENKLYLATVLNGKSSEPIVVKSNEMGENQMQEIEGWFANNSLQASILFYSIDGNGKRKAFGTNWAQLHRANL
jgi:hypothetical protein